MKTVVVCDAIHQKGFEILKKEANLKVIDASKTPKDELLNVVKEAHVVITRSSTPVDLNFLNHAVNLQSIVRAGVGVDNVDIEECSKRGIIVMNVPGANTIAAVELTFAHMLSAARKFPQAHNHLKNERIWKREKWYGIELSKKSLGVIGFGNIGSRVAKRAKAFGMQITAYDPYVSSSKITENGFKHTESLDDILKCDFITIHTPKTNETINIISKQEIAKMKDGVILINCARGGLYNEDALVEGLNSGKISYLGIDVFMKEPATNNPLLDIENVSVTAHLGANTLESQENIATEAADQAINAARGTNYPNALNLPIKKEELPEFVIPYIELLSKMSSFASQINKNQIKSIKLEAEGNIAKHAKSLLTFAIVGALKESLGDGINYVNANFVTKDKNINTSTQTLPQSGYNNKLTINLTTDKGLTSVSGTVFDESEQRIVEINGFKTDFKPKGKMLVFKNTDVPGVIMELSSILAEAKMNIADFRLGRGKHGNALAVVLLDEHLDKQTLSKLNKLDNCLWAEYAVI